MRLWWAPLYAAAALAWAEEPPVPQAEEGEDRQVIEVLTEEDLGQEAPKITLKQLTPKETISLDDAVDMPSDI